MRIFFLTFGLHLCPRSRSQPARHSSIFKMLAARRVLCGYARRVPVLRRPSARAWSTGAREVAAAAVFRTSPLRPSRASLSLLHRQLPVPAAFLRRGYAGKTVAVGNKNRYSILRTITSDLYTFIYGNDT